MIIKKIKIPIYEQTLYVSITEDYSKDKEKYDYDWRPEREDFRGNTSRLGNEYLIILNRKYLKDDIDLIGTISHESFHVTNMLFKRIGAYPDADNDEPQNYLLTWIIEQVYKIYKNYEKQK
jgi:hypothetical protein